MYPTGCDNSWGGAIQACIDSFIFISMALTKKIEQEVLKVYNTGWDAYLRGDLKTHAACLSRDFKIIGTTEVEHFNTKKAWLAFCKKTIHQVVGVCANAKPEDQTRSGW